MSYDDRILFLISEQMKPLLERLEQLERKIDDTHVEVHVVDTKVTNLESNFPKRSYRKNDE